MSANSDLNLARSVIRTERDALDKLESALGNTLIEAVDVILSTDSDYLTPLVKIPGR